MILGEDESARLDREIDSSSTAISGINRGMMMMRTSFSHSLYFFIFVQSLDYNLSISLNLFPTKKIFRFNSNKKNGNTYANTLSSVHPSINLPLKIA